MSQMNVVSIHLNVSPSVALSPSSGRRRSKVQEIDDAGWRSDTPRCPAAAASTVIVTARQHATATLAADAVLHHCSAWSVRSWRMSRRRAGEALLAREGCRTSATCRWRRPQRVRGLHSRGLTMRCRCRSDCGCTPGYSAVLVNTIGDAQSSCVGRCRDIGRDGPGPSPVRGSVAVRIVIDTLRSYDATTFRCHARANVRARDTSGGSWQAPSEFGACALPVCDGIAARTALRPGRLPRCDCSPQTRAGDRRSMRARPPWLRPRCRGLHAVLSRGRGR